MTGTGKGQVLGLGRKSRIVRVVAMFIVVLEV